MIDLTPLDVRKKRGDFKKIMRGYDPYEVDSFLELAAERLEALVRENLQMRQRTETLQGQVDAQQEREQAVQDALVTAQELRNDIQTQSQREADHMLREADAEARRLLAEAKAEARGILSEAEAEARRQLRDVERRLDQSQDAVEQMEHRRSRFLREFRNFLERELDMVVAEERKALEPVDRPARSERPLPPPASATALEAYGLEAASSVEAEAPASEPAPESGLAPESVAPAPPTPSPETESSVASDGAVGDTSPFRTTEGAEDEAPTATHGDPVAERPPEPEAPVQGVWEPVTASGSESDTTAVGAPESEAEPGSELQSGGATEGGSPPPESGSAGDGPHVLGVRAVELGPTVDVSALQPTPSSTPQSAAPAAPRPAVPEVPSTLEIELMAGASGGDGRPEEAGRREELPDLERLLAEAGLDQPKPRREDISPPPAPGIREDQPILFKQDEINRDK